MDYVYNEMSDTLYIYKMRGELKETKQVCEDIFIDYNENGEIYGIEILHLHDKQQEGQTQGEVIKICAS